MLTIHRRSVNSTELLKVGVEQAKAQVQVDITTLPVEMAVMVEGDRPETGDYTPATWETINGVTYASTLVGPGGIQLELTDETYIVWVGVTVGGHRLELKSIEDVIEVY